MQRLLILTMLFFSAGSSQAQTPASSLLMCADHYPPFSVYDTPAGPPRGSVVEVVKLLATEMGYSLRFTPSTPFRRCLRMMADGKVDLMGGLLYKDDRADYMHLFRYLNHSTKSFYARHDSSLNVERFADLTGLTIGTTLGHQYWPAFDESTDVFRRSTAAHVNDNFRRLLAGRIDLVIATERQALFLLDSHPEYHGKFRKMAFSYTGENPVYIGLSKKSEASKKHEAFQRIAEKFSADHTFERLSEDFYRTYFSNMQPKTEAE